MTQNARTSANQKSREKLDAIIASASSGAVFLTKDISTALSRRIRGVSTRTAGTLMREREDVKYEGGCRWVKI